MYRADIIHSLAEHHGYSDETDTGILYRVIIQDVVNELTNMLVNHEVGVITSWTHSNFVWFDCGNTKNYGQILVGTEYRTDRELPDPFVVNEHCTWLPSPATQHPELLVPLPEESRPEGNLSCAELALQDSQGLSINKRVAAEAADFLIKMLITRDLQRYACYMDLESGSARSLYITPNQLSKYLLQEG